MLEPVVIHKYVHILTIKQFNQIKKLYQRFMIQRL